MNALRTGAPRRPLIIGTAVILLAAAAGFLLWNARSPIGAAEVEAFLDRTQGGGRVQFSVERLATLHRDRTGGQVAVSATARTIGPLYTRIDTPGYLRKALGADPSAVSAARRILVGAGPATGGEATAPANPPEDPYLATVIEEGSPAGASFEYQGIIDVSRDTGGQGLVLVSGGYSGAGPKGEPRTAFPEASHFAGDPKGDAQLRRQLADFEDYAGRVAAASRVLESGRAQAASGRQAAFLEPIAPGRVFRGMATEDGMEQGTPLYLEITGVSPGNGVSAVLRNEGGWHLARAFEGSWSADEAFEHPMLALSSSPRQAVPGGGPFLEDAQTLSLDLAWDPGRGLSGRVRRYRVRFEALSPREAKEVAAGLGREFSGAEAAMRPGLLYIGTATLRSTGASEPILLRIGSRSEDGGSFDARIESTAQAWRRPARGTISGNARRSGGYPIRIETDGGDVASGAPGDSVLGFRDDLEILLSVREGTLKGEDAQFSYRLEPALDSDLRRLAGERQERASRLMEIFRPGISFDGTLREEQGFRTPARLEVDSADPRTGAVTGRIRSLSRKGIFREFAGSVDADADAVVLEATSRGRLHSDDFDVPFLKTAAPATLSLTLGEASIEGRIQGVAAWTMDFPCRDFAAARVEPASPGSPPGPSPYPPFPTEDGAYALHKGAWERLPKNLGRLVEETERPSSNLHLTLNVLDAVGQGMSLVSREKEKQKTTYLEFTGKDPQPSATGPAITVIYVGVLPAGNPMVELAPCEPMKDGGRRVKVAKGEQGMIRLGDAAMAAFVRQVAPRCVALTTTAAPEAGPYAFNADTGYELKVE
jgi:hypothetical protein